MTYSGIIFEPVAASDESMPVPRPTAGCPRGILATFQ